MEPPKDPKSQRPTSVKKLPTEYQNQTNILPTEPKYQSFGVNDKHEKTALFSVWTEKYFLQRNKHVIYTL